MSLLCSLEYIPLSIEYQYDIIHNDLGQNGLLTGEKSPRSPHYALRANAGQAPKRKHVLSVANVFPAPLPLVGRGVGEPQKIFSWRSRVTDPRSSGGSGTRRFLKPVLSPTKEGAPPSAGSGRAGRRLPRIVVRGVARGADLPNILAGIILLPRDGAAAARRAHNPEVGGANPPPATRNYHTPTIVWRFVVAYGSRARVAQLVRARDS